MGLVDGNVALVTGGTSGIGRAKRSIALSAREGVAPTGRQVAKGESVVADIQRAGGQAVYIQAAPAKTACIPDVAKSSRVAAASVAAHIIGQTVRVKCGKRGDIERAIR
jgi:NAD(P)-dependent dehydrogenase (short-subunit alcohol dehydrogenase family)